MRSRPWNQAIDARFDLTNYFRVRQSGAQITQHSHFEDVLTRIEYLKTRSDAPIEIDYTDNAGRTFRPAGWCFSEAVKVMRATA